MDVKETFACPLNRGVCFPSVNGQGKTEIPHSLSLLADLAGSGLSTLCLGRTHTESRAGWGPLSLADSLHGIDFNTQKLKEHQM